MCPGPHPIAPTRLSRIGEAQSHQLVTERGVHNKLGTFFPSSFFSPALLDPDTHTPFPLISIPQQ
jgi:hypothetical protein